MVAIRLHSEEGWSKISRRPDTATPVALGGNPTFPTVLRAFIWHLTEGCPLSSESEEVIPNPRRIPPPPKSSQQETVLFLDQYERTNRAARGPRNGSM